MQPMLLVTICSDLQMSAVCIESKSSCCWLCAFLSKSHVNIGSVRPPERKQGGTPQAWRPCASSLESYTQFFLPLVYPSGEGLQVCLGLQFACATYKAVWAEEGPWLTHYCGAHVCNYQCAFYYGHYMRPWNVPIWCVHPFLQIIWYPVPPSLDTTQRQDTCFRRHIYAWYKPISVTSTLRVPVN